MKEIFRLSAQFTLNSGLKEPESNRGILHEYLHGYLHIGISVFEELLIQEIEYLLDEKDYPVSKLATSLYGKLSPIFISLWRSDDFQ